MTVLAGLLLIVVSLVVVLLLILLLIHLLVTEAPVQVLICCTRTTLGSLRATTPGLLLAASHSITPATRCITCVHLREKEAKHGLAVCPI